ncbi:helix-turn-helix domain-containing protein [Nocardia sp. NPDC004654]|uniref:helix-turn-helix domain-containing protein n=1 Tax=Nocardia sp. NPDC004654 TaxID=3154776 RepID=UPI00339F8312
MSRPLATASAPARRLSPLAHRMNHVPSLFRSLFSCKGVIVMARRNVPSVAGVSTQSAKGRNGASRGDSNSCPSRRKRDQAADRGSEASGNRRASNNLSGEALDYRAVRSVDIRVSPKFGGDNESPIPETGCWLTTEEVSKRLKIPEKTLANWASLGKGPRYARMGRYRRYRLSDLILWEESQLESGGAS